MPAHSRHNAIVSAALAESQIALQGLRQLLNSYDHHILQGKPIVPELSSLDPILDSYWTEHHRQTVFGHVAGVPWVPIVGAVPGGLAIFFAASKLAPTLLPSTFAVARYIAEAPRLVEQGISDAVAAVHSIASHAPAGSQAVSMSSLDYAV
jgi:hypothetical protein